MNENSGIRKEMVKKVRRIVLKIGSSTLTGADGRLSRVAVERVVSQIADATRRGIEVVMVTSGAIAAGLGELGIGKRPQDMARLQAAAAVGQCVLMQEYTQAFKKEGLLCAQVLLTNEDLKNRSRYLNIRNTLFSLLSQRVIPVINENDTVSTQEIQFGDNDRLSALVTQLLGANLLVLLSDVDGLLALDKGGVRVRVSVVESVDAKVEATAWDSASKHGTGGMKSKLQAARMVTRSGEATVIANGSTEKVLEKILNGENVGTLFLPKSGKMAGRKRWIAYFVVPQGRVIVDAGAKTALLDGKKSLLASGIRNASGDFRVGDTVSISGEDGEEFARGIVAYGCTDVVKIAGKKTNQIYPILQRATPDEVIHRDNLVVL